VTLGTLLSRSANELWNQRACAPFSYAMVSSTRTTLSSTSQSCSKRSPVRNPRELNREGRVVPIAYPR